jgi:hypothetical protein
LIVLKDEVKRDENRVMKFRGKVQSHSISIWMWMWISMHCQFCMVSDRRRRRCEVLSLVGGTSRISEPTDSILGSFTQIMAK